MDIAQSAITLLTAFDKGAQVRPLSERTALDRRGAYAIADEIAARRVARGEEIVGRKIGFTNRELWPVYGVDAPMWAPMYNTSVARLPDDGVVRLPTLAQPRIEPEIAFRFRQAPEAEMALEDLAHSLEWMAHGFEIVTSPFPDWHFQLTDCIAAQALHGCFWYGPPRTLPSDLRVLEQFDMEMDGPRGTLRGQARHVLGGPLHALKFLLDEIAKRSGATPLRPGDIVTTGTLTDAGPVAPGETWSTRFRGLDLPGLTISFAPRD